MGNLIIKTALCWGKCATGNSLPLLYVHRLIRLTAGYELRGKNSQKKDICAEIFSQRYATRAQECLAGCILELICILMPALLTLTLHILHSIRPFELSMPRNIFQQGHRQRRLNDAKLIPNHKRLATKKFKFKSESISAEWENVCQ